MADDVRIILPKTRINEGSWFSADVYVRGAGQAVIPTTLEWKLYNEATGRVIVEWTALAAAASTSVAINAGYNVVYDDDHTTERMVLLVVADRNKPSEAVGSVSYQIVNVSSYDAPPEVIPVPLPELECRVIEVTSQLVYSEDTTITDHLVFTGSGQLVVNNGVTVTLNCGYTAHDYQHVFNISAGGTIEGLQANYVTPQHFGATAEGSAGDDTAAIQAAIEYATLAQIRDEYATSFRVLIPPVPSTSTSAFYHVTSDIIVNRNIIIEGGAPHGRTLSASKIKFSDDCNAGFWFQGPGGDTAPDPYSTELGANAWSAGRSIMRHLSLEPVNTGMVDYGIIHNWQVSIYDVTCYRFNISGFFAHAAGAGDSAYGLPTPAAGTMWGNSSQSIYERCFAWQTQAGPGFASIGGDGHINTYLNCDAVGNKGAGFHDKGGAGSTYVNCHTSGNTYKLLHNGVYYMPLKDHTATADDEPGIGADWEDYWWILPTATIADDTSWAIGEDYTACGSINILDEQSTATIIGCYTEGGIEGGIVPRGFTTVVGGVAAAQGRVLRHPEWGESQVITGGSIGGTPVGWKNTNTAGEEYGCSIGGSNFITTPDFLRFGHSNDNATNPEQIWKLRWQDTRDTYELQRKAGIGVIWLSGEDFSRGGYSGENHLAFPNGFLLGDGSGASPNMGRMRAIQNNGAIAGDVVVGDWFIYTEPVAGGKVGAVVTTAGTVGSTAVVKEFGVIDA